jgi:integrase
VDFAGGTVRLDPGTTKNREGRVVVLTADLKRILVAQWEEARAIVVKRNPEATPREVQAAVPWVFNREGERIKSFRRAWLTACKASGLLGRIPHDFRRTAVRNMVRAGIPERVAMMISGHKTRSVFERYNIVSEGDLRAAAERLSTPALPAGAQLRAQKRKTRRQAPRKSLKRWWAGAELNCRHQDFQSCALPTELPARPRHESRD